MNYVSRAAGPLLLSLLFAPSVATATEDWTLGTSRKVDEVFAHLARTDSPGCAVGVVRGGELRYAKGYGMASLETGMAITESTVFYAGSVSKQFAAAAVLLASQDGSLALDDSLGEWFPELPAYAETIRVSDLVHHTSGLRDYLGLMALAGIDYETPLAPSQVLDLIARQRELNFPPGTEELYSNSGYFLMAQLVGRATGRSLREYSEEKIFGPLGMHSTHFHDDRHQVVARRAAAYQRAEDRAEGFTVLWSPAFDQVGSGGLLTTIEDLARWERAARTGALGDGFWPGMLERGKLRDGTELDYAFGISHGSYRGKRRVQHGGAMFGYRAYLTRYPELDTSIALLCNVADANPGQLADRVSGRRARRPARTAAQELGRPRTAPRAAGRNDRRRGPRAVGRTLLEPRARRALRRHERGGAPFAAHRVAPGPGTARLRRRLDRLRRLRLDSRSCLERRGTGRELRARRRPRAQPAVRARQPLSP